MILSKKVTRSFKLNPKLLASFLTETWSFFGFLSERVCVELKLFDGIFLFHLYRILVHYIFLNLNPSKQTPFDLRTLADSLVESGDFSQSNVLSILFIHSYRDGHGDGRWRSRSKRYLNGTGTVQEYDIRIYSVFEYQTNTIIYLWYNLKFLER